MLNDFNFTNLQVVQPKMIVISMNFASKKSATKILIVGLEIRQVIPENHFCQPFFISFYSFHALASPGSSVQFSCPNGTFFPQNISNYFLGLSFAVRTKPVKSTLSE